MSERLSIPPRLPVMMLPGCNLFPQGLLPLHLFEPRYRMMLAEALQGDRMFCIGTLIGPEETFDPKDCIHPVSTAGFIRACVQQPDGCSNLLLQGLQRVRLSDFQSDRPYVTAAITAIETTLEDPESIARNAEEVRRLALQLMVQEGPSEQIRDHVEDFKDPEVLGDLVAYHFVTIAEERHHLLGIGSLSTRLEELRDCLERRLSHETSDDV